MDVVAPVQGHVTRYRSKALTLYHSPSQKFNLMLRCERDFASKNSIHFHVVGRYESIKSIVAGGSEFHTVFNEKVNNLLL